MCGRFSLITVGEFLSDRFKVEVDDRVQARYNIAPSTDIPIITNDDSSKITMARWGLVPTWAKDQSMGYKMINARAETVAEKSAYRVPFRKHRCLIPADGFYEWKKANGKKIPYRIIMKDKGLFAFAGLFDIWNHNEIEIISCTIITTSAGKVYITQNWIENNAAKTKRFKCRARPGSQVLGNWFMGSASDCGFW